MAMIKFDLPTTELTRKAFPVAKTDRFMLGQLPDFIEACAAVPFHITHRRGCLANKPWYGSLGYTSSLEYSRNGNMDAVAKSDELLSKLESMFPVPTARHVWVDDVTGGFCNVPAMLAGQPLNMRRKVKRENEAAPLAIVANLLSSSSVDAKDVLNRGIAILALVRVMANVRPVELWVGVSCQGSNVTQSANIYFQIPTTPLDLARAAHLISHPSISRAFGYSLAETHFGTDGCIPFAYGAGLRAEAAQQCFHQTIAHAFPHMADILAIPMLYQGDRTLKDPVAWIAEKVAVYSGEQLQDA